MIPARRENGGIAADFKSVTWKLKPDLKWSDGTPFTSEDVKFTAEYCMNPDGGCAQLAKYDTYFVDSLTVLSRMCLAWCKTQPAAFSEKTGKPDIRGAYGLHGREMIGWLTHLQHTRGKNVWFVGILDEKLDDFNRKVFQPQIDGSKTGLELPGIVDEVITMAELKADGDPYRAFVCQTLNPWGYPAKDRSGRLDRVEPPHLGRLMEKIQRPAAPASERLTWPPVTPADPAPAQEPGHG